jgi:hypothetical protein
VEKWEGGGWERVQRKKTGWGGGSKGGTSIEGKGREGENKK